MQIAPINNSHTSFKRVIKINNIHTPNDVRDKYLANDNIYAVERILNNNPSSLYNEQEQAQIKEFIKDATRDYKWDVLTRRIPNLGVVLVTGSDVAKITKMEKRQKVQYNPNVSVQDVKNMRIEKALLARLEDGSDGKPRTVLEIYTASPLESYERVLKQGIKADKIVIEQSTIIRQKVYK